MMSEYLGVAWGLPLPPLWITALIHTLAETLPLLWIPTFLLILCSRRQLGESPTYIPFILTTNIFFSFQLAALSSTLEFLFPYLVATILLFLYAGINYKLVFPKLFMELIAVHFLAWIGISAVFYKLFVLEYGGAWEGMTRLLSMSALAYGQLKLYSNAPHPKIHWIMGVYWLVVLVWLIWGVIALDLVYVFGAVLGALVALIQTMELLLHQQFPKYNSQFPNGNAHQNAEMNNSVALSGPEFP